MVASVVRPERTSSACTSDSMLLQGIQPTETPLKIWAQSNGRINSYRPFEPVLWLWRWHPPTDVVGVHLRFDATRRKTAYGNSLKNLGAIQRSDQKLWKFAAGIVVAAVGRPERTSSTWSRDSRPLQGKQPTKTPQTFKRDPTIGSKVVDLFSRYCNRVSGTTRTDIVGVE